MILLVVDMVRNELLATQLAEIRPADPGVEGQMEHTQRLTWSNCPLTSAAAIMLMVGPELGKKVLRLTIHGHAIGGES